jgi:hypothetical protein
MGHRFYFRKVRKCLISGAVQPRRSVSVAVSSPSSGIRLASALLYTPLTIKNDLEDALRARSCHAKLGPPGRKRTATASMMITRITFAFTLLKALWTAMS